MKNTLFAFVICSLWGITNVSAQGVSLNATGMDPDSSAILDMSSTTKGMLVPRMTATQKNAIPAPATGLMVYQTDGVAGFYYYNGVGWAAVGSGWSLNGNAGTIPGTNFIGTTDATALVFKVNNIWSGEMNPGTGNTSFGRHAGQLMTTGTENSAYGEGALHSNTTGKWNTASGYLSLYFNTTGTENTATGKQSLYFNTLGQRNVAYGFQSMSANTTGNNNTASGYLSLQNNSTGNDNTAAGYVSMTYNSTGSGNVAAGAYSLINNMNGNNITAIGYYADVASDSLTNATAIGNGAVVAASNTIKLGNNSVTNVNTTGALAINSAGTPANASAIVDLASTDKGMLIPRMTNAQKNAIASPATGLMIFQTDGVAGFYYYTGSAWSMVGGSSLPTGTTGDLLYNNGSGWVSLPAGDTGDILMMAGGVPVWSTVLLPAVTTAGVSSISFISASCGGNVTSAGLGAVSARGVCWSTSPNPTIAGSHTTDGTGTGSFTSTISGLASGTTYYVRAYATNGIRTTYGGEDTFTTFSPTIGASYGGGKIAYVLVSGDPGYDPLEPHGLIVADSDQSAGATWGCSGSTIGSTSTAYGTGTANTDAILAGCPTPGIAARVCRAYAGGGYADWFLPSKDELNKLQINRIALGMPIAAYWSSSEIDISTAWIQTISSGVQAGGLRAGTITVRAVRYF